MARYFRHTSGIVDNVVKSITFHKFQNEITVLHDGLVKIEADDVSISEWLSVQNCDPIELSAEESAAIIEAERKALVPQSITKVQTMRVLKLHSLWDTFNTILASSQDASDEWTLAIAVERDNPFVVQLAPLLGLSEIAMDDLFIEGSTL